MRITNVCRWLFAVGVMVLSAGAVAQSAVRISEFHYDNAGVDSGEAIEVSAPAGTDLTGWSIVLYNGANGQSYDTDLFSGVVTASCGNRGVAVLNYPANGIQNGSPDGIALVDNSGALIEFLSYEGTFVGVGGAAGGVASTDIVASQNGNGPAVETLQRNASGAWALAAGTFGSCNDNDTPPTTPEVASVALDPESESVFVGSTVTLNATAFDAANAPIAGALFTWSSSDTTVASVGAGGVVSGESPGIVTITATAANGVSGTATVQVDEAPPPPTGVYRITEIHYDNLSTDADEAIEIDGPLAMDVTGFRVVLYNGNNGAAYNTQTLDGGLPPACGDRGLVVLGYPQDGIQNGAPDGIALVNNLGQVIEFLSYEGTFTATDGPAAGMTSTDIGVAENSAPVGMSLQRDTNNVWYLAPSTFGACNPESPTPVGNSIQFSGRTPTDVPLPVGYEDQLFGRLVSPGNQTVLSTFTWEALTPATATIDAKGVVHALAEGSATFRATADFDGTTATWTLPMRVAVASGVTYPGNTEFGEPTDADSSDDFIVRHEQFTASHNPNRGGPNWVSYDLDAAHFGLEDRCDCFTMDPDLPASFARITTADYTDAGAFHGYGIDRGHMTRSFDRTTGSLDNARTYLFSNVVPQASDMNQGPWANLENDLGDLARVQGREVYVITGPAGNKGTLKNEGKIVIPSSTWKVAVILPHDDGLSDIVDYRDLEVIAVNMPNEPGVRNVDWNTYRTTVDAIEALTGYDLLALLPDDVEAAVESNTQPPLAAIGGPAGTLSEGDSVTFNASGSVDPDGSVLGYEWDFGDGSIGSGVSVTHTYAQDGIFTIRLTVTDNDGLTGSKTFAVTVTNVAPVVAGVAAATLNVGATYMAAGTFADPGADTWTATVNWGDGSGPESVALASRSFSLTHIYTAAGVYTVTVSIADDDASASTTTSVTVQQPSPGLAAALTLIDNLIATGKMPRVFGVILKSEVITAQILIGRGNTPVAASLLKAMVAQINLLVRCRVVKATDVAPLRALLVQVIGTL